MEIKEESENQCHVAMLFWDRLRDFQNLQPAISSVAEPSPFLVTGCKKSKLRKFVARSRLRKLGSGSATLFTSVTNFKNTMAVLGSKNTLVNFFQFNLINVINIAKR